MNQIKYLVTAAFLLLILSAGIFVITTFYSPQTSSSKSIAIDFEHSSPIETSVNSNGKLLFSSNCQTCHALDKNITGPALRGVESRGPWTNRKNLIKWVKNPATTINQFEYTKNLVNQYGQIMPSFSNLTDKEIESIFDYITKASSYSPASMPVASK